MAAPGLLFVLLLAAGPPPAVAPAPSVASAPPPFPAASVQREAVRVSADRLFSASRFERRFRR